MAEYNKTSLINIKTEDFEVLSGSVSRENSNLVLSPTSSCRFKAEYLFSKDTLKTNSLCAKHSVINSDVDVISRHKPNFKINVHIQYYKKDESAAVTSYVPGPYSTNQLYPYYNTEKDRGFISEICFNINNELIKSLYIDFVNDSENDVTVIGFSIYKEQTTAEVVSDVVSGGGTGGGGYAYDFENMEATLSELGTSGISAKTEDNKTVTIAWKKDEYADNVFRFNVSDRKSFYIVFRKGEFPYVWSDA